MGIDKKFQNQLGRIADGLDTLAAQAARAFVQGAVSIGEAAVGRLGELTPRSDDPGPDGHLADHWALVPTTPRPGEDIALEITNTHPEAFAPIEYEGGTTTLIEILEFGTRPHEIRPKNGGYLVFNIGGARVRAKVVQHPGTRPYAMLEITRHEVAVDMLKLNTAVRRVLAHALSGRLSNLRVKFKPSKRRRARRS